MHRQWLRSLGLHPASGSSIALAAAAAAAAATARGDSADPVADIAAVHAKDTAADATDCADLDVAIIRALDAALADERDMRAVQVRGPKVGEGPNKGKGPQSGRVRGCRCVPIHRMIAGGNASPPSLCSSRRACTSTACSTQP